MKYSRLLFWLVMLIAVNGCSSSNNVDYSIIQKDIHTSLQEALNNGGTSVSFAVMQNGNIIMADALGFLDGTKTAPATINTLYNIGSLSKIYTAAAVMKLVDDGSIGLDDPVVRYMPEFRMKDSRYTAITVRMLLNHSSGMLGADYTTGTTYGGYDTDFYNKTRSYFAKSALKSDPGTFSVYCNDGFEVAELLVAKVSGMTFDQFVREKLFNPLALSSPGYATRSFVPGSYAVNGSYPHEFLNVMGSGGVNTTLVDLVRFGSLFISDGKNILKQTSIKEINRAQGKSFIAEDTASVKFGLGWDYVDPVFSDVDFGKGVLAKSGGTSQFTSQLYVIPKHNLVAAISVTSDFSGDAAATLRNIIAKVLRAQGIETALPSASYTPLLAKSLPTGFETDYAGYYGSGSLQKVTVNSDQTITLQHFDGTAYVTDDARLWFDGQQFVRANGEKAYRFVQASGRKYLMKIKELEGKVFPYGQKLESGTVPPGAWGARLNRLYMPAEVAWNAVYIMNGIKLFQQAGLDGILFMWDSNNMLPLGIIDNLNTGLVLNTARDLNTLTVETVNGEEWLANESYSLRPAASLPILSSGSITIPASGANALYSIPAGKLTISIPDKGRLFAYDQSGVNVYDSLVQGKSLSLVPQSGYIRFVGQPGTQFAVTVSP